jgi:hypothetical protein
LINSQAPDKLPKDHEYQNRPFDRFQLVCVSLGYVAPFLKPSENFLVLVA